MPPSSVILHMFIAALTILSYESVCGDQVGLSFSRADAFNRIVDGSFHCLLACNLDPLCNGINYHSLTNKCEAIHYCMRKQLLTGQENADGWQLWLPERCPELISPRSAYPGGSITLVISGRAIIDEIYCHITNQELYHYLNLHGDNQAISDRPYMKGSRFTKYQITLPRLEIQRDATYFRQYLPGYHRHNIVGYSQNCNYDNCNNDPAKPVYASYTFNITGTSFELADDDDNRASGWQPRFTVNLFGPQYAMVRVRGCCGVSTLGNINGTITLQLKQYYDVINIANTTDITNNTNTTNLS